MGLEGNGRVEWEKDGRRKGQENLRERDDLDGGRTETESKERNILTEAAIMGLARNVTPENFLVIHKDDPKQ